MLTFSTGLSHRDCDGSTRRDFLKAGTLGMGGLSLANLLAARSQATEAGLAVKDTSVVWLWLGGGPTHIETFDPKMSATAAILVNDPPIDTPETLVVTSPVVLRYSDGADILGSKVSTCVGPPPNQSQTTEVSFTASPASAA